VFYCCISLLCTKLGKFILEAETWVQVIKTGSTKTDYNGYVVIRQAMLNRVYSKTALR
jgi:hypothetical protein